MTLLLIEFVCYLSEFVRAFFKKVAESSTHELLKLHELSIDLDFCSFSFFNQQSYEMEREECDRRYQILPSLFAINWSLN